MDVLTSVRVLDFGRYIAGPWCAALLADFGADVIRIDKIGGGEDRDVMPLGVGNDGAMYQQMNRNKRCMSLATSGPERDDILRRLVESADIVIANVPDTALETLGLSYDRLSKINPKIILTTVSAFGHEGPLGEKVGFDVVAQATSGAMHLTGHEGEPMRSTVSWVDFSTATLCAFGTLAALTERNTSGKGQHVRGSLLATALTTSSVYLIEQALSGINRSASGNRSQLAAPADMFWAKDGHIVMQAIGGAMFRRWARLVGAEGLLGDPRMQTDETRAEHAEEISDIMQNWCSDKTVAEILSELERAHLPAAQVLSPQQCLDHPQVKASGLMSALSNSESGAGVPVVNTPVHLSRTPGSARHAAPSIGAHTRQILSELGYSLEDINGFQTASIVE